MSNKYYVILMIVVHAMFIAINLAADFGGMAFTSPMFVLLNLTALVAEMWAAFLLVTEQGRSAWWCALLFAPLGWLVLGLLPSRKALGYASV